MKELFDYYDESSIKGLKTVIGSFVSHNIEWYKNGDLISVSEVNNLNRIKLAEHFLKKRTYNGKYKTLGFYKVTRDFEEYELINDIAQFIDLKIPFHYWIRLYENNTGRKEDRTEIKKFYKGIDTIEGLEFIYEDNYILESIF